MLPNEAGITQKKTYIVQLKQNEAHEYGKRLKGPSFNAGYSNKWCDTSMISSSPLSFKTFPQHPPSDIHQRLLLAGQTHFRVRWRFFLGRTAMACHD